MENMSKECVCGTNGCAGGCCSRPSASRYVLRGLLAVVVLFTVFSIGLSIGAKMALHRMGMGGRSSMMRMEERRIVPGGRMEMKGDVLLMRGDHEMPGMMRDPQSDAGMASIFGSIVAVDGNRITLKDNGNDNQVVLSQADTMITSGGALVTLGGLRVGQNVLVMGMKEGEQVKARTIKVML